MKAEKKRMTHGKNLLFAAASAVLLLLSVTRYVGMSLGGNWDWLPLSSHVFGIPEEMHRELQMEPLFDAGKEQGGWDGQFYYSISNDLLGQKDTAEHIDSPSYRYQRIGFPFLAKIVSLVFLQKMVTVPVYVLTSVILIGIAAYVMSVYLNEKGCSGLWTLMWILASGTLVTMRHLLPDCAADALVLTALILALQKKYSGYSAAMTLGCLTREAFILPAFLLFCLQLFRELKGNGFSLRRLDYKLLFKFAFPGIIFILWYAYVTVHFGVMPMAEAAGVQGGYMKSWAEYLGKAWESRNLAELFSLLLYGVTVVYALLHSVILGKKNPFYWTFVPYIILVSSFGPTVMSHWSGYLKGISILYGLLPLMLAETRPATLVRDLSAGSGSGSGAVPAGGSGRVRSFCAGAVSFVLPSRGSGFSRVFAADRIFMFLLAAACIALGVKEYSGFQRRVLDFRYSTRADVAEEPAELLKEFGCELEIAGVERKKLAKGRLTKLFTEDYDLYTVRVKNTSGVRWSKDRNPDGSGAVCLSCRWFKEENPDKAVAAGIHTNLTRDLAPGEETLMDLYVRLPRNAEGKYVLRISLLQEKNAWFYRKPKAQYIDLPYEFGR